MKLPKPDSIKFYQELKEFERRQPVPHINIAELVGYERGRKEEREIAQRELKKERERAEREKLAIAAKLKGLGLELEAIVEATGLPASEVEKL